MRGLETRPDCHFFSYPKDKLPDLSGYVLLTPDAPPLTREDASYGLLLVDGTWRHAQTMIKQLPTPHLLIPRSLPSNFQTAYPRRQEIECGLASIEALFIAYFLTGKSTEGLLDNYYWKEDFLKKNEQFF